MNVVHCMVALVARSTVISHGQRELSLERDVYAKFGEHLYRKRSCGGRNVVVGLAGMLA